MDYLTELKEAVIEMTYTVHHLLILFVVPNSVNLYDGIRQKKRNQNHRNDLNYTHGFNKQRLGKTFSNNN